MFCLQRGCLPCHTSRSSHQTHKRLLLAFSSVSSELPRSPWVGGSHDAPALLRARRAQAHRRLLHAARAANSCSVAAECCAAAAGRLNCTRLSTQTLLRGRTFNRLATAPVSCSHSLCPHESRTDGRGRTDCRSPTRPSLCYATLGADEKRPCFPGPIQSSKGTPVAERLFSFAVGAAIEQG